MLLDGAALFVPAKVFSIPLKLPCLPPPAGARSEYRPFELILERVAGLRWCSDAGFQVSRKLAESCRAKESAPASKWYQLISRIVAAAWQRAPRVTLR